MTFDSLALATAGNARRVGPFDNLALATAGNVLGQADYVPIVSTARACPGSNITLTAPGGTPGFGASQGASTITIGGVPMTVVSWSATAIVATVPITALSGQRIQVTVIGGGTGWTYSLLGIGIWPAIMKKDGSVIVCLKRITPGGFKDPGLPAIPSSRIKAAGGTEWLMIGKATIIGMPITLTCMIVARSADATNLLAFYNEPLIANRDYLLNLGDRCVTVGWGQGCRFEELLHTRGREKAQVTLDFVVTGQWYSSNTGYIPDRGGRSRP